MMERDQKCRDLIIGPLAQEEPLISRMAARQKVDNLLQKFSTNTSVAFIRVLEAIESSLDPEVSLMMIVMEPQLREEGLAVYKSIAAPKKSKNNFVSTYTEEMIVLPPLDEDEEDEAQEDMQEMENKGEDGTLLVLQRKSLGGTQETENAENAENQHDRSAIMEESPPPCDMTEEEPDKESDQSTEEEQEPLPGLVLPPIVGARALEPQTMVPPPVLRESVLSGAEAEAWLNELSPKKPQPMQEPVRFVFNATDTLPPAKRFLSRRAEEKKRWFLHKKEKRVSEREAVKMKWHEPAPEYVPRPATIKPPFVPFKIQTRPDPRLQPRPIVKQPDICADCGRQGCLPWRCTGQH